MTLSLSEEAERRRTFAIISLGAGKNS